MDRLEEVKGYMKKFNDILWMSHSDFKHESAIGDIVWMVKEIERLQTVEQAYQALLSATAGQRK